MTLESTAEVRVKLANGNPFDVLGALLARLAERGSPGTKGEDEARVGHPSFERGDQTFGAWLDNVRRQACGGDAYRDASPDREGFAALLDDERSAVPLRAAAAYALLTIGTDDDLALVTHALVNRALPPLVLVVAGLAPGGSALVDDELFAEMNALLPAPDREATTVASARSDAAASDRVATALAAAKQRASDDVRGVADAHARAHAGGGNRRALHPVSTGAGNAGRWVGRSWGL